MNVPYTFVLKGSTVVLWHVSYSAAGLCGSLGSDVYPSGLALC